MTDPRPDDGLDAQQPTGEQIVAGAEALHSLMCGCDDRYIGSDDVWTTRARAVLRAPLLSPMEPPR